MCGVRQRSAKRTKGGTKDAKSSILNPPLQLAARDGPRAQPLRPLGERVGWAVDDRGCGGWARMFGKRRAPPLARWRVLKNTAPRATFPPPSLERGPKGDFLCFYPSPRPPFLPPPLLLACGERSEVSPVARGDAAAFFSNLRRERNGRRANGGADGIRPLTMHDATPHDST